VYTAYDYTSKKVGLAYAQATPVVTPVVTSHPLPHPTKTPTRIPTKIPTSSPIPQPSSFSPTISDTMKPSTFTPTTSAAATPTTSPTLLSDDDDDDDEGEVWSWLEINLVVHADESPSQDVLLKIVNALLDVVSNLGDISNVVAYDLIDWSPDSISTKTEKEDTTKDNNNNNLNKLKTDHLFFVPNNRPHQRSTSVMRSSSSSSSSSSSDKTNYMIHLRGKVEDYNHDSTFIESNNEDNALSGNSDNRRRLSGSTRGLGSVRIRTSAGDDVQGLFDSSEQWLVQVALDVTDALSSGSLDFALANECSCNLTAGKLNVSVVVVVSALVARFFLLSFLWIMFVNIVCTVTKYLSHTHESMYT
jgi:hypothetical protein